MIQREKYTQIHHRFTSSFIAWFTSLLPGLLVHSLLIFLQGWGEVEMFPLQLSSTIIHCV
jgi:hypothetical protein